MTRGRCWVRRRRRGRGRPAPCAPLLRTPLALARGAPCWGRGRGSVCVCSRRTRAAARGAPVAWSCAGRRAARPPGGGCRREPVAVACVAGDASARKASCRQRTGAGSNVPALQAGMAIRAPLEEPFCCPFCFICPCLLSARISMLAHAAAGVAQSAVCLLHLCREFDAPCARCSRSMRTPDLSASVAPPFRAHGPAYAPLLPQCRSELVHAAARRANFTWFVVCGAMLPGRSDSTASHPAPQGLTRSVPGSAKRRTRAQGTLVTSTGVHRLRTSCLALLSPAGRPAS